MRRGHIVAAANENLPHHPYKVGVIVQCKRVVRSLGQIPFLSSQEAKISKPALQTWRVAMTFSTEWKYSQLFLKAVVGHTDRKPKSVRESYGAGKSSGHVKWRFCPCKRPKEARRKKGQNMGNNVISSKMLRSAFQPTVHGIAHEQLLSKKLWSAFTPTTLFGQKCL